jgi:hypothetical protein
MSLSSTPPAQLALYAVLLALPLAAFAARRFSTPTAAQPIATTKEEEPKSIMQPARDDLAPPLDTPYTRAELSAFDGSDPSKLIYVAIKGSSSPSPPPHTLSRHRDDLRREPQGGRVRAREGLQRLRGQGRLAGARHVQPQAGARRAGLQRPRPEGSQDARRLVRLFLVRPPVLSSIAADGIYRKRYNVVGKVSDIPGAEQPAANL